MAGTAVDVILFPLDTLKTRLQSVEGFVKAGGFRGIYSGIASAASGSAPSGDASMILFSGLCPFDPSTPMSDQDRISPGDQARISPGNMDTISSKRVMRIKKNIN